MKKIIVNYNGSGVKTLRLAGFLLLVFGVAGTIALTTTIIDFLTFMTAFFPAVTGLMFFGICLGLAKLVELSLIAKEQQAVLLEKEGIQIEFVTNSPQAPKPATTVNSSVEPKKDAEV